MVKIDISDELYKKLLHYARKDEDWTQTLARLYGDAQQAKEKELVPFWPPQPQPNTWPGYSLFTGTGTGDNSSVYWYERGYK